MSCDPGKDKELKTWKVQLAGNKVIVSRALKRGGKVIFGRVRRGDLDELLELQKAVNRAVEKMLFRQTGGAVIGSWLPYENLQNTLLKRLKEENPRGYSFLIAHISERVEKKGDSRGLKIRIDKFLIEILTGVRKAG